MNRRYPDCYGDLQSTMALDRLTVAKLRLRAQVLKDSWPTGRTPTVNELIDAMMLTEDPDIAAIYTNALHRGEVFARPRGPMAKVGFEFHLAEWFDRYVVVEQALADLGVRLRGFSVIGILKKSKIAELQKAHEEASFGSHDRGSSIDDAG